MKVKVELTLEVVRNAVLRYLRELGNIGEDKETPSQFIKSSIIADGVGCFEDRLNHDGHYPNCKIIKTNINW